MRAFVNTISSVSHQDSFRNDHLLSGLRPLDAETDIVSPDYKAYIQPAALRRLSPVLRMGLTAAMECEQQAGQAFDAISVGTALGCLRDTEKFLVTFHTATSDVLSPTAFIQSTHNTIGGQISLGLNNHAYNMTHTQNNLSFEVALLDALLCLEEGKTNVLVGAAEEKIDFLEQFRPSLISDQYPLTSGATFLALSPDKGEVGIRAVHADFHCRHVSEAVNQFLNVHSVAANQIGLVCGDVDPLLPDGQYQYMNYLEYSGLHYSAGAFGFHMAHDFLRHEKGSFALVVNNLCPGKLGIILLERP